MALKIMQYNILNGFHSENEPFELQQGRQDAAVKTVKEANPDILVLCEASFAFLSRFGIVQDYKRIFGYPYCCLGRHGEKSSTAVLSKLPLDSQDFGMHHRAFMRTSFSLGEQRVVLDVVHPHPSLSDLEKERLFRNVLRDRPDRYILVGDFNACSPQDKYNRGKLVKGFSGFTNHPQDAVDNLLNSRAIGFLVNEGLVDTFVDVGGKGYTVPTDLRSKDKSTGVRLDYIFCSSDFKVSDAGIVVNALTENASDHYPIYAVLESS